MRSRQSVDAARGGAPPGLHYAPGFVSRDEVTAIVAWLAAIGPIWEQRFSTHRPLPPGVRQRRLLRPVYWLGNWQFACLDYYRPPRGIADRCVRAEPHPPALAPVVARIEAFVRARFSGPGLPARWRANTCLVNLYGDVTTGGKRTDVARVGEHRDFEPGPVASLSLGERALFQFVRTRRKGERDAVVFQQWLEDGSLQVFGGPTCKERLFHRVQRVERKAGAGFSVRVPEFDVRRVNFTFRFVPDEHVVRYRDLSDVAARDVADYMGELARHSPFFRAELDARARGA
jgi:alkylated DNA repair dioxygenase AlkB